MLWKLKSAKRKTTKKQNVLIAFNKGIASAQGIELAMLFSHAGFDVKSIFFEGAEEYVSAAAIKDITEHSPWSSSHKPGWVKADFKIDTAIVIEPEGTPGTGDLGLGVGRNTAFSNPNDEPQFCEKASLNKEFTACINNRCKNIKILTAEANRESFATRAINYEIITLPDNLLKMHEVFEGILADVVKLTASKALNGGITYCFNGDISSIEYIKDLKTAFEEYGIEEKAELGDRELRTGETAHSSDYNELSKSRGDSKFLASEIVIGRESKTIRILLEDNGDKHPENGLIYLNKHKNGLIITDSIEIRLLPDFSCKSCFSKFIEYLREEMDRE